MKLNSLDLEITKFGREIDRFLANTERKHWEGLIRQFNSTDGIFYKCFLLQRNPLIKPLQEYFDLHSKGKSIWKHRSEGLDFLAEKAFITNRIIQHANEAAKNQIKGRYKNNDIRPLLFELLVVTHFLNNGFDVKLAEYERDSSVGRTFDFLLTKDSIEAEVECKFKSYDAGRKIKRGDFYRLCDEIFKQLKSQKIKCLIEINCLKKLDSNHFKFIETGHKIKTAIYQKKSNLIADNDLSIKINYLPKGLEIKSDEQFKSFIEPYHTNNTGHFATLSNQETTIIVKAECNRKDLILRAIYNELKDSLDQFSKNKPGLIACYIEGIYPEEWEELQNESGLAAMTYYLFNKENAEHIHTVSYISEVERSPVDNTIIYKHPTLLFKNQNCSYYKGQDIYCLQDDKYQKLFHEI